MEEFNLVLNRKLAWRFLHSLDDLWARVVRKKYIRPSLMERSDPSPICRAIKKGVNEVVCWGSIWRMDNGRLIRFWVDHWMPLGLSDCGCGDEGVEVRVSSFWIPGAGWNWHLLANILPGEVLLQIASCSVVGSDDNPDSLAWSSTQDENYSVATAYKIIHPQGTESSIDRLIYASIWKLDILFLDNSERMRRYLASGDARGKVRPSCTSLGTVVMSAMFGETLTRGWT
ncbi:hypothetical protein V2J09_007423 [Rumex salicifolius]